MYPEAPVLVAYVPRASDFDIIRREGWYRIPQRHAPRGLHADVLAFYFGRDFGPEKWAIHYYAERLGHELVRRRDLLPDQPSHPRADDLYYKIQLGPLQRRERPIVSLRWRRVLFIHTTWDRFRAADEINDLFISGGPYVDRLYALLRERALWPQREYRVRRSREGRAAYTTAMSVVGARGRVDIDYDNIPEDDNNLLTLADAITAGVAAAVESPDTGYDNIIKNKISSSAPPGGSQ